MSPTFPEVTYTPASRLNQPLRLFRDMLQDLWNSRELAWRLFVRDICALYRQTALGLFWAFLPPIATTIAFVILNSGKVLNIGEGANIPYPAFVMLGTVLWELFKDSLNAPIYIVTRAKTMLSKINFPQEALILSGIGEVLFSFSIKLFLLIPIFWWFKVPVAPSVILVPVAILFLLLFGTMIGMLLVPIGMLFQDFSKILPIVMMLWMLFTPVVYPPTREGILGKINSLNPVSPLIVTAKNWVVVGFGTDSPLFWLVGGIAMVLLLLGWVAYKLSMPIIIERMQT
ncbi:MAG: ABC transporter permease [bacterium]